MAIRDNRPSQANELGFFKQILKEIVEINPEDLPSEKKFGSLFSIVAAIAAIYSFWIGAVFWLVVLGSLSLLFLLLAYLAPGALSPVNRLWYRFGLILSMIFSPVTLGVIFFFVITPVSLLTRAFGRDALHLKKVQTDTYWVKREIEGPGPETFDRQF